MKKHDHKRQFKGFFNTPNLWEADAVFNLEQFELPEQIIDFNIQPRNVKQPLGKQVEGFVFQVLNHWDACTLIATNLQINQDKISIGELDALLEVDQTLIHLEIVYKFYLYREQENGEHLHKWIGPNRKDDLMHKLNKLHDKQLPLLHEPATKKYLTDLGINPSQVVQKVLFKAQLFVPLNFQFETPLINKDCIAGFFIHEHDLVNFKNAAFHLPIKKDWLVETHQNVEWMNFASFSNVITEFLKNKQSPLCWIKQGANNIQKYFVVWWD